MITKYKIAVIVLFLSINGCGSKIIVPIDQAPLSLDKSTLIIYCDQGFDEEMHVFMDKTFIGNVHVQQPLKLAVTPGYHEFYLHDKIAIDRITKIILYPGSIHYLRAWIDLGTFVSSVRIDETGPVSKIETTFFEKW